MSWDLLLRLVLRICSSEIATLGNMIHLFNRLKALPYQTEISILRSFHQKVHQKCKLDIGEMPNSEYHELTFMKIDYWRELPVCALFSISEL